LLDAVKPSYGRGVEISDKMVEIARAKYPDLHFLRSDPEDLELDEKFDYIVFSHIFDTVDLLVALERLRKCCHRDSRVVIYIHNYLWQPVLELGSRWGLRIPSFEPNWVSEHDLKGFLHLAGFEAVRTHRRFLFPKWVPLLSYLLNDLLASLPAFRRLCLVQVTVARSKPLPRKEEEVAVSVIIPCRNERDNVLPAVERMPHMGRHTEIILCDDKSTDGTGAEVERLVKLHPERDIRLVEGPATCKADNVWTGFRAARGDVLMILDGDLAVMRKRSLLKEADAYGYAGRASLFSEGSFPAPASSSTAIA
jgi:Glycosyl transferase family 2/Methyltransferase domain